MCSAGAVSGRWQLKVLASACAPMLVLLHTSRVSLDW